MAKLDFISLEIDGFKSFVGEPHVLPLREFGPGLHFVQGRNEYEPRLGPNGAGKSTIWDAIAWCLYGKTPDGSRNPDIRPWFGKQKHTAVDLKIKVDGKKHWIVREANPNALLLDGKPVGQEQIDQLIGLSFAAFTHTLLLGQGRPLFFDLAPRDKMQLLSDAVQLERWEDRSALASDRAREFEQKQATLDGELIGLKASKADLEKMRDDLKAKSADWELTRGDILRRAWEELEDVKRRLGPLQEKHAKLDPKEDWTASQIITIQRDAAAAEQTFAIANAKLIECRAYEAQLIRQKAELEKSLKERVCPTCGQNVKTTTDLAMVKKRIATLGEKIATAIPRDIARKAKKAEDQLKALRESLAVYRADAESLRAELAPVTKSIEQLTAQKNELERTMAEREEQDNPFHGQLKDIRRRLSKIENELRVRKAEHERFGRRAERARFWVKGFKDVRLYVIEDVLQELELATNAALDDVGLIGWAVHYDVEKETKSGTVQRGLNVLITSPSVKRRVRWESWSGGEGQRLRVVGALALSEVLLNYAGVQTSLEILDEPAHFMAPAGVRDLTDYLAGRAKALGRATFYVDHLAIESSRFSSVTTVVKTKSGSRLEW